MKTKTKFYEDNDHCETCEQNISKDVKKIQFEKLDKELNDILKVKPLISDAFNKLNVKIETANEELSVIRKLSDERKNLVNERKSLVTFISNLKTNETKKDDQELITVKEELESLEKTSKDLEIEKIQLTETKHNQEICKILLKDEGIKAKIIKQYIPIMNKLINNYLDRMGASYSFHLDESFNEIIKSRYRDNFTYSSFSEGEKRRIDLALMFTWREVAKIKNSAVSNLLILDEVGDSSMDGEGTDVLWEILGDLKDTNIFVISHRTANVEKFTSHIHIVKEGNFSKIVNSK